jgi:hypothetical protein
MKIVFYSSLVFLCVLFSCSKSKNSKPADTPPANLAVNVVVSTDSSGNVFFTATATNAVSYDYELGDGASRTSADGKLTYKYTSSGTYTVTVTASSSGGSTLSKSVDVTVIYKPLLIWSEEFDTDGAPNPAVWGYDLGGGGWGNNELENYTNRPDNVIISNGTLKIIAKAENYNGSAYTSARILTKGKFGFKYGKIEVRAKLPPDKGTWPAIWMLGSNIDNTPWPACGEIDIMEHVANQLNKIFGTIHFPGHSGANGLGGNIIIPTATTDFHRYAVIWTPGSIQFSIDDAVYFSTPNSTGLPFNQNFFIILNVAMGGGFGGTVDPAFTNAQMEVDYVRVYQ